MPSQLHLLILEDFEPDVELMLRELRHAGFDMVWQQIDNKADYLRHLQPSWDCILADYRLPQFNALEALQLLNDRKLDIPFIVVTGELDEAIVIECIKRGAVDYLHKDRLSRLGSAVSQALEQKQLRDQKRQAEALLRESEEQYRGLVELSPDGIAVHINEKFVFINQAGAKLIGADRPDLVIGRSIYDFIHPDYREIILQRTAQIASGTSTPPLEQKFIRIDGSFVDVETVAAPYPYRGQVAVQVIFRDITDRKKAEAALVQRNRELTTIQYAGAMIASTFDIDQMLQTITREMVELLDVEAGIVFEWQESSQTVVMSASYDLGEAAPKRDEQPYFVDDFPLFRRALTERTPIQIHSDQPGINPADLAALQQFEAETLIILPLVAQDQTLGLITLQDRQLKEPYPEREIGLIQLLANQAASAIENVHLFQREKRRAQEAEALHRTALALVSTLNLDQVIERILAELAHVVAYDSASVQLLHDDHMVVIGSRGFRDPTKLVGRTYPVRGDTPNAKILAQRQPLILGDVWAVYPNFSAETLDKETIRAWLGVPLFIGEGLIGMLTMDKNQVDFYTDTHARTATTYAAQAAIAIENARLHTEAQEKARQMGHLRELGQAISASLRSEDVYHAFAQHAFRLTPYDWLSLTFVEGDQLRVAYVAGQTYSEIATGDLLPLKTSILRQVVRQGQPLLRHLTAKDGGPDLELRLVSEAIHTLIFIPLKVKSHIIGTWNIGSKHISAYGPNEIEIAQLIADQLVSALENARLYQQARQEITERSRAEAELAKERALLARRVEERTAELSLVNAELARAARLKDEFLASMSHELRTPLNAILGLTEVLQMNVYGLLNDRQQKAVGHIQEGGRHLLELINDILDLSKIEAGKLILMMSPIAIEDLCQACLRLIKQVALKKQIRVQTKFAPIMGRFEADERRLKQILVNLLSNAVKFTPDGGEIGLEVESDLEQNVIRFIVWDTGIGISSADLGRLFKPFVQLDSTLARQHEGTGLGLALVSRLTELHGGGVAVESELHQGSRFIVTLPWPSALPSQPFGQGPTQHQGLWPQRALLIEDSPSTAKIMARHLQGLGIETLTQGSGQTTLSLALEFKPDLIVLDIFLQDGHSGWDVLRSLKDDRRTEAIPVIIASTLDEPVADMRSGIAAYLVKPVTQEQLAQVIKHIWSGPTDSAQPLSWSNSSQPHQTRKNPLILLAEDNETNIIMLMDFLISKGYQVRVARDGAEAIKQAQELKPALIMMDIQMPTMDGLTAMKQIRADEQMARIPIIALTALAMPGDRERCLSAGANEYLTKPIQLDGLRGLIDQFLGASEGQKTALDHRRDERGKHG